MNMWEADPNADQRKISATGSGTISPASATVPLASMSLFLGVSSSEFEAYAKGSKHPGDKVEADPTASETVLLESSPGVTE